MLRIASAVRRAVAPSGRDRRDRTVRVPLDARPDATRRRARAAARRTARRRARRRRACRSSRASPSTWPCTPPGRDSEYGDVIDDSHGRSLVASRLSYSRSLGQFGCSRCHCSGAARISASNSWASTWVIRATSSRSRPSRYDRNRRPHLGRMVATRSKVDRGRQQRRPGAQRERRRAARAASCARRRTRPRRRRRSRSRSHSRHTMRLSRSACSSARRRTSGPSGTTSSPSSRRWPTNHSTARAARSARRPRACDGPCTAIHAAGPLPSAEVRQGEDHAVARARAPRRCARSPRS